MKRAMIIDPADNRRIRLAILLQSAGFAVERSSSALAALTILEGQAPDLLMASFYLDDLSAAELCGIVKDDSATQEIKLLVYDVPDPAAFDEERGPDLVLERGLGLNMVVSRAVGTMMPQRPTPKLRLVGGGESELAEAPVSLSGSLEQVGLTDLLQLLESGGKTGRVTLEEGKDEGSVDLDVGVPVGARWKGLEGRPALSALLRDLSIASSGRFRFHPRAAAVNVQDWGDRISLQRLIFEAFDDEADEASDSVEL